MPVEIYFKRLNYKIKKTLLIIKALESDGWKRTKTQRHLWSTTYSFSKII